MKNLKKWNFIQISVALNSILLILLVILGIFVHDDLTVIGRKVKMLSFHVVLCIVCFLILVLARVADSLSKQILFIPYPGSISKKTNYPQISLEVWTWNGI